ncbi:MAG: hypothetical protein GYB68_11765 [Chloroflexi bacterium]|nr:hypothetical protein [Chloroflexota bacterium]
MLRLLLIALLLALFLLPIGYFAMSVMARWSGYIGQTVEAWQHYAEQSGLHYHALLPHLARRLEGEFDGRSITLRGSRLGRSAEWTEVRINLKRASEVSLALVADRLPLPRPRRHERVMTGDPDFDAAYHLSGGPVSRVNRLLRAQPDLQSYLMQGFGPTYSLEHPARLSINGDQLRYRHRGWVTSAEELASLVRLLNALAEAAEQHPID